MAMIKCIECGKEISDKAPKCPGCGCPNVPKMDCPECKQKIDSTDSICPNCGIELTKKSTNNVIANNNSKSKIAAGLLGILLGCFGAHNFYLGYTGKAVAQLLITLLSCFIFSFVSAVWGLIEGIMILTGSINTDANGNELVD